MDENKEEKPTTDNIGAGDKPKEATLIEQATAAAKRLEDATAAASELRAKEIIEGKSEGASQESDKKEETPAEYAKRVMEGKAQ